MLSVRMRIILFVFLALFAILIGFYPAIYLFIGKDFGLLSFKDAVLFSNPFWNIGFYGHISLGGLALLIGWTQFITHLRIKSLALHRNIGKIYVLSCFLSALFAFYIAFYATGGWIASIGFMSLALVWIYTTFMAYRYALSKRITEHKDMMIYSYACTFAAVSLRIYLPFLVFLFHDFEVAYRIVAWLCWIPNLLFAMWLIRRLKEKPIPQI